MAVNTRQQSLLKGGLATREAIWFYILIGPWIAGMVLFTAGPILAAIYLSFTLADPASWPPKWIGTANYSRMFADALFWKSLTVTAYYTFLAVPLNIVFATIIALVLNEKIPGVSAWRTIYYLPSIVSGVPVAIMWSWVFQPSFGLLNGTLYSLFGIVGPGWLVDTNWVIPTFVLMSLWQFGGPMLIYLAGIQGVPTQLYESAMIDGANALQQIRHITLPSITPVIFFNAIMAIIGTFQVFTPAYVITLGGPNYASWFMVYMIYQNAFRYIADMGYASALSWALFLVMLIFTGLAFGSARYWVFYETDIVGGR
jgi:multiple sugar transport system permease protein